MFFHVFVVVSLVISYELSLTNNIALNYPSKYCSSVLLFILIYTACAVNKTVYIILLRDKPFPNLTQMKPTLKWSSFQTQSKLYCFYAQPTGWNKLYHWHLVCGFS